MLVETWTNCTNCCGTPIPTPCCPGHDLNTTLYATITNKTGDCVCLPDSATLVYNPAIFPDEEWDSPDTNCSSGCPAVLFLKCVDPDGFWDLGPATCIGNVTHVSQSCSPFQLVFDVDNALIPPGGNCYGTFRVTITE